MSCFCSDVASSKETWTCCDERLTFYRCRAFVEQQAASMRPVRTSCDVLSLLLLLSFILGLHCYVAALLLYCYSIHRGLLPRELLECIQYACCLHASVAWLSLKCKSRVLGSKIASLLFNFFYSKVIDNRELLHCQIYCFRARSLEKFSLPQVGIWKQNVLLIDNVATACSPQRGGCFVFILKRRPWHPSMADKKTNSPFV